MASRTQSSRNGNTSRRGRYRDYQSSPVRERSRSASPRRAVQSSPSRGRTRSRTPRRAGGNELPTESRDGSPTTRSDSRDRSPSPDSQSMDDYKQLGKSVGRMVDMFTPFKPVLEEGYTRDPEADPSRYSKERNRRFALYRRLQQLHPSLHDDIRNGQQEFIRNAASALDTMVNKMRTEDLFGIKAGIDKWRAWNPSLPTNDRSKCGFMHPQSGRLLCPTDLDWEDTTVQQGITNGTIPIPAEDLCNLCYAEDKFNPADVGEGFMRNDLLIDAALHIWRGPTFAKGKQRTTKRGNAQRLGIDKITVPAIAYVAVLVRFALSSQTVWNTASDFDYSTFYYTIVDTLEDMEEEELDELLTWWNEKIFGDIKRKPAPREPGKLSLAERLKARNEAKKANKRAPLKDLNVETPTQS